MDWLFFFGPGGFKKEPLFFGGARVSCGAAAAAFPAAVSISCGKRLSRRCGAPGLPTGVQHSATLRTLAAEPALPIFFAALSARVQSQTEKYLKLARVHERIWQVANNESFS